MNSDNQISNKKAGILVPTKNRADFVIRLLNYYANLNSPHTIYIGDSSNEKESARIRAEVEKLKNKINISYSYCPELNGWQCIISLYSIVKEPYATLLGDDDYWIPEALTECIEFLEKNPEYATAIGRSVTFKVEGNKVYGNLKEIHDYQRYSIEADTASQRLLDYVDPLLTTIVNTVARTEHMLKFWKDSYDIEEPRIKGELMPCCYMVIEGKSKVIDRLGFIRQIHDSHFHLQDIFDEITSAAWPSSYALFHEKTTAALMAKDKIIREEAQKTVKKAMWSHLNKLLPMGYYGFIKTAPTKPPAKKTPSLRRKIAANFPLLKRIYRRKIIPLFTSKPQLHYEVMEPGSKYYNDFKGIVDSLKEY